jgi:hypothetical protein
MIADLLHVLVAALACFFLWRLWRSMAGRGRASLLIAAGFLIRAFGGQVLFWISYLRLPVARTLQLGKGFWFFAVDGPGMLDYSLELITDGPLAWLFIRKQIPSHAFIQVFTLFAATFGVFASVAILFNCVAFLGTCAIILRIGPRDSRADLPRLVALAAMALGPGTILWALQLLKDTFCLFLIAAMIAACFYWQALWRDGAIGMWRRAALYAIAMFVVLYAIAGMRWYVAVFFWGAWSVFGLLTVLSTKRKLVASLIHLALFVVLAQAVRIGGANDVPRSIQRVLDPRPSIAATFRPRALTEDLVVRRRGFEDAPAATTISVGKTLEGLPLAKASAGLAAAFLPRFIGESLGLVRIGGGRGFWFFVELDTLVFDAVFLFAIIFCARSLRAGARVTPLFVLLVIVFLATAGPLAYTVNNFGTLFRLRQVLYVILAFLPLTLGDRPSNDSDAVVGE